MKPRVSIVRVHENRVEESVSEALNLLGGLGRYVHYGEPYLIKPNLFTTKTSEQGATTDMRIVLTISRMVKELGAKPVVGECPAMAAYARPDMVFEGLGIRKLCEESNIELKVLDREKPKRIKADEGVILNEFWFPEFVLECRGIINVPKLKTHVLTTLTCAVKNLFGLQQGGSKARHHVLTRNDPKRFGNLLLDLYSSIRSRVKINVVDSIICMEGEGPTTGDPVNLGLIIAGTDAVAVDMVASKIIGWDPMEVGTNYLAVKRGLAPSDLREIEIVGEALEDVTRPFKKPQTHQDGRMFVEAYMPIICDELKCVNCGICSQICPGKAIEIHAHPEFDEEKCIQCFCCIELCPQGALRAIRKN